MSRYNRWADDEEWAPYVSVAERRGQAEKALAKIFKKGEKPTPIVISGRTIATTFWGKAWCDNLEAYSDYENRLPRGMAYVRNGSVVDLKIDEGKIVARVSGSSLYTVEIKIQPLADKQWKTITRECAGGIDSLVELLSGKLSNAVMEIITRQGSGLFPAPKEIEMKCSCPDFATLCKHVAATLYGVGARLDHEPNLLFLLRNVDQGDLIQQAGTGIQVGIPASTIGGLDEADLSGLFGIDLAASQKSDRVAATSAKKVRAQKAPAKKKAAPKTQQKAASKSKEKTASKPEKQTKSQKKTKPKEALSKKSLLRPA